MTPFIIYAHIFWRNQTILVKCRLPGSVSMLSIYNKCSFFPFNGQSDN